MNNDFQKWLRLKGYYRRNEPHGAWIFEGKTVSGMELYNLLNEWKELKEVKDE